MSAIKILIKRITEKQAMTKKFERVFVSIGEAAQRRNVVEWSGAAQRRNVIDLDL